MCGRAITGDFHNQQLGIGRDAAVFRIEPAATRRDAGGACAVTHCVTRPQRRTRCESLVDLGRSVEGADAVSTRCRSEIVGEVEKITDPRRAVGVSKSACFQSIPRSIIAIRTPRPETPNSCVARSTRVSLRARSIPLTGRNLKKSGAE